MPEYDIFKQFREHSVAEFFKKNRQMLGFYGKVRSLTTVVHEYVTNSLDGCEEAGILPNILIKIELLENGNYKVMVKDNGPGIPKQYVGRALGMLLAGTKFHRYMQQRGQQGIGASGCTLFSQITTGKPTHVKSSIGNGMVYECNVSIDVRQNKPNISDEREYEEDFNGLFVEVEFGEVKYDRSEYSVLEYLRRTALANPHAEITFTEPSGERYFFPRVSTLIPPKPIEAQPHPLGITAHDLIEMAHSSDARKLSSFFSKTFARMSAAKINELRYLVSSVDLNMRPDRLKWEEAEEIVKAFKKMKWIAPATDVLRPIGKEHIESALKNILNPEFISVAERKPRVFRGGVPFLVEAAIAYSGNAGKKCSEGVGGNLIRFANRAPLLFDGGTCAISEAVKSIDWKRYEIKNFDEEPISVFVNFVSVHVPYTGAGKQAISAEEEIVDEIRFAVMEGARELQAHLKGKTMEYEREAKKSVILRYVKQLSEDLPYLSGVSSSEELEKRLIEMIKKRYEK